MGKPEKFKNTVILNKLCLFILILKLFYIIKNLYFARKVSLILLKISLMNPF